MKNQNGKNILKFYLLIFHFFLYFITKNNIKYYKIANFLNK